MSDAERFELLYAEHRTDLERFVQRRVPPPQVEDIVAETFLVAWRRIADLPEDVRPWLFGVARHVALRSSRSLGRWNALHVRLATEPPTADDDLAHGVATRTDLARAWTKLSPGEQEVLALVAWDGLSPDEAANVLGCRTGTFRMRLTRARRHLLAILDRLPEAQPHLPAVMKGALS